MKKQTSEKHLGRPYVYGEAGAVTMMIRVPTTMAQALHEICRDTHVPMAEIVRQCLQIGIDRHSRKK